MRRSLALTIAALAVSLALPAAAADVSGPVNLFKSICMKYQGDIAGAEAAALAQGLEIAADNRGKTLGESDMEMVFHGKDGAYILLIGPMPDTLFGAPGAALSFCGVLGQDEDSALLAAGKALPGQLALPVETEGDDTYSTVFYRERAGGRVPLPDSASQVAAAIRDSEFRSYDVRRRESQTMISLTTGLRGNAK